MKTLALAVCLCAGSLLAQPQPPSPDALKTALGLTDAQVEQLVQIQRQKGEAIRPVAQQIRDKHAALQQALAGGANDPAALGRQLLEIEALRKQIQTLEQQYRDQAASVLNADQKTKLKALEDAQKLAPAIGQAHRLGLLAAPAGAGPGAGPGQGRGPGMGGPGAGPGPGPGGMGAFGFRGRRF